MKKKKMIINSKSTMHNPNKVVELSYAFLNKVFYVK